MADYTWTFATTVESWTGVLGTGPTQGSWDGTDGSPAVGCLNSGSVPVGDYHTWQIIGLTGEITVSSAISYRYRMSDGSTIICRVITDGGTRQIENINWLGPGDSGWVSRSSLSLAAYAGENIQEVELWTNQFAFPNTAIGKFDTVSVTNLLLPAANARFYQGAGVLTERFTLPFTNVQPGGMTLNKTLGTVVIASSVPAGVVAVYSDHPYPTGTATDNGLPTGTAITSIKWI